MLSQQSSDQAVTGMCPLVDDQGGDLCAALSRRGDLLLRCGAAVKPETVQAAELRLFRRGDPEQLADDQQREGFGEQLDEIGWFAGGLDRVEVLGDALVDPGLQLVDLPRGELRQQQPPHPGMG
ncbi:hypothetical protein GCM10029964_055570 [Kibdelosporangium lantanae]